MRARIVTKWENAVLIWELLSEKNFNGRSIFPSFRIYDNEQKIESIAVEEHNGRGKIN